MRLAIGLQRRHHGGVNCKGDTLVDGETCDDDLDVPPILHVHGDVCLMQRDILANASPGLSQDPRPNLLDGAGPSFKKPAPGTRRWVVAKMIANLAAMLASTLVPRER